jgi:Family of unknown function (DUF695)
MTIFRRRRRRAVDRVDARAQRFWSWWDSTRPAVATAVETAASGRLRALLEPRVREYHRELTWHVGPGTHARYRLVVSGARHPALRGIAERWRMVGPVDDAEWEYHPAFPPEPTAFDAPLQVGDVRLDPAQAVAMATPDDRRYRVDLLVHHSGFDRLPELARNRVANRLVAWALGEDEIDRWVGRISATEIAPLDPVPVRLLAAVTGQLAERWAGERWAILEGSFDAQRLIAQVRHPLHRVDYPLFDEHIAVRLPYADAEPDGLPTESARADLKQFEDVLVGRLRSDALLVAQQTASGERLLHFYADSASRRAYAIRVLIHKHLGPLASVHAEYDPGWQRIGHLRA